MKLPNPNFKSKKEEITYLLSDKVYTAKDSFGNYVFKQGKVLKFNYEGSITAIKITRIDRQKKRTWGQHIELIDQKIIASHTGHQVQYADTIRGKDGVPFCSDCNVRVNEPSTEDGEVKAAERADRELSDGTPII